jgi:drug/metabolite transporter (DMT)-like permease
MAGRPDLSSRTAFLLFLVVVLVWGTNWTVTKIIVASVTPLWTSAFRSAVAAVGLFVLLVATRNLIRPPKADLPVVAVVAAFHMVGFSTLVAVGLTMAPVGRSIVLGYTTPLWVLPGACLFLGEAITARKVAGVAVALAGLGVLFNPTAFDWSDRSGVFGSVLLLLAAASWAISIVYVRAHRWVSTPFQMVFWQTLLATALLSGAALVVDGAPRVIWTPALGLAVGYAGLFGTALAYWAMMMVNKSLPAVTTSLGVLCTPLVGIATAAIVLGEPVSAELIISFALVALGIGIGTRGSR